MTFHSKSNSTAQDNASISITLAELDTLNNNLSAKVTNDISQTRINALKLVKTQQQQALWAPFTRLARLFSTNLVSLVIAPKAILPIGVAATAIIMMFSFTKLTSQSIPEIPQALASVDMPNEDLALLQDLEFVTWLAAHEQEI